MYHIARRVTRRLASRAMPALTAALARPADALEAALAAESERLFFWSPVVFGAGIAAYFALPAEPPLWLAAGLALFAGFALFQLGATRLRLPALTVLLMSLGLFAAVLRTALVAAPILPAEVGPAMLEGVVEAREQNENGVRLVIRPMTFGGLKAADLPARLRISVRAHGETAGAGDRIAVRAVAAPPSPPAEPGAFDFQRYAFYRGFGGYGYAVGPVEVVEPAPAGLSLAALRETLGDRILRAAGETSVGATAAALLIGERGAIAEEDVQALRDSGLAHLLSISGLHMSIVAGFLFFLVRLDLAAVPGIALRRPIKKWAALAALVGGFLYLLLSGSSVPAVRAFVMIALVMLAVLTDRRAISLRNVAIAAFVVLALTPEALVEPGFQMSFAAVTALIAYYERYGERLLVRARQGRFFLRAGSYLAGVAVTTLIAGLATAPFAVFHFNRIADYGVIANLAAIPLTTFWIMPAGTFAMLALPLGLEDLPLAVMGRGIELVLAIAHWSAGLPGAVRLVPAMPVAGFILTVLGGLWLCLWSRSWRVLGLIGIAAGFASPYLAERPLVRVDGDGRLLAVTASDGKVLLSSVRRERFVAEQWLARDAQAEASVFPENGVSADGSLRCDGLGCIWRRDGWMVALPRDGRAIAEDCQRADVVIAIVPVRGRCPSARIVVDRFDLWREGPHALWLDAMSGPRVVSVAGARGVRPWIPPPLPRAAQYWRKSATSRP